jgi:hypothetical protein
MSPKEFSTERTPLVRLQAAKELLKAVKVHGVPAVTDKVSDFWESLESAVNAGLELHQALSAIEYRAKMAKAGRA